MDKDIEKLFKKHKSSVQHLGLASQNTRIVDVLSTGSLQLDYKIKYGGIPQGRITHIYGPTRSLKSTIAMNAVKSAFNKYGNPLCMVLDFERTMDSNQVLSWYKYLGFTEEQADNIIIARDMPEKCFDLAQDFVQHPRSAVLVVDSAGAMEPSKTYDKSFDENAKVAGRALLIKQFLNRINTVNNNCAVIIINQVMDNFGAGLYGPSYTYGGGHALKHMPSLALDVRGFHTKTVKGDKASSNDKINLTVRIEKCKTGGENQQVPIIFDFSEGKFDEFHDLFSLGYELGLLQQMGSWFSLLDSPNSVNEPLLRCQGEDNLKTLIKENPTYVDVMKSYILSQIQVNQEVNYHESSIPIEDHELEDESLDVY